MTLEDKIGQTATLEGKIEQTGTVECNGLQWEAIQKVKHFVSYLWDYTCMEYIWQS